MRSAARPARRFAALLWSACLCCTTLCSAAAAAEPPLALARNGFALVLPNEEAVAFHGVLSADASGGQAGAMLYPAPGLAGLLAAIVTHGVIVESAKSQEKARAAAAADAVIDPFREALRDFSHRTLMAPAVAEVPAGGPRSLVSESSLPAEGWIVRTQPVFFMTQDRAALVLLNAVTVQAAGQTGDAAYRNVVKVVSAAHRATDLGAMWGADSGRKLKELSSALFVQSLDLLLEELARAPDGAAPVHKTFRYVEGGTPRVERAQLLQHKCDRAALKTLRGWLLSIPQPRPSTEPAAEGCDTPMPPPG